MILIDPRVGSKELISPLIQQGLKAQLSPLDFADVCFEGNGPKGSIMIGVECKKLHDILDCIDTARFSAHQLPGLVQTYDRVFLLIEGEWCCHDTEDLLMEKYSGSWGRSKYRRGTVRYSKLYRYLIGIGLTGVTVTYSRNLVHTARNISDIFHYFQKPWASHTSLHECQMLPLSTVGGKATLAKEWAARLPGVGTKHSRDADLKFKTPMGVATATVEDWMSIKGIGVKTAKEIVRRIKERR